ncbi:UDP-N-acetylmuramoyl-L-alanyl-D-glutamate--2,6-diaminopimelate ligase [Candidatus Gracilibacteria bacterium]|nr:UDP-N-acetylmuramoyl-L-alanyl-D-glutamate--2,6-diaminopimelate ligase [Candidatus Gracilibacteria bacterium]
MLRFLRRLIPERSPLRLGYHKILAIGSAVWFWFPAKKLKIIAVTGTSGKSTTCELIYTLLHESGQSVGMLSGIQFHFPSGTELNESLRTTLRSWSVQKYLRRMLNEGCVYAVVEVSSHAIDQHRLWGVPVDIAVLTNVATGEHLDYHGTFAEYVQTKARLFRNVPTVVLNRDDSRVEIFEKSASGAEILDFSRKTKEATVFATSEKMSAGETSFDLSIRGEKARIDISLTGEHNIENTLAAVAVAQKTGVSLSIIKKSLARFKGVPGRLEPIDEGQDFTVLVDHTYKPPALRAVLTTLKKITPEKLFVVWGGTGNRLSSFWSEAGEILHELADEIVLTTDDPYKDDPRKISQIVREKIPRQEGDGFFEITDRYEAIRYALFVAENGDTVLVAGRGCEQTQTIGTKVISFDDREVCREIIRQENAKNF